MEILVIKDVPKQKDSPRMPMVQIMMKVQSHWGGVFVLIGITSSQILMFELKDGNFGYQGLLNKKIRLECL